MIYLYVKTIHVSCVALSGSFFALRGVWMLNDSALLGTRVVRVMPHLIDTALLLSAAGLCILTRQYPLTDTWLTLKLVLLLAYVTLGMYALHWGTTKARRCAYWAAALVVFGFICLIAITKPTGVAI